MANVSAATENADQLRRRANRRLLGASVLLLIAIILVPLFLEREPPPLPDNVDVKIPPIDGTKFDPKLPERKGATTEVPSITEPSGAAAAGAAAVGVAAGVGAAVTSATPPQPQSPQAGLTGASAVKTTDATKNQNIALPPSNVGAAPKADTKSPAVTTPSTGATTSAAASPKSAPKAAEKTPEKVAEKPALKSGQLVIQLVAVRDPASAKQVFDQAKALKVPVYTEQLTVANGVVTRVRVGPYADKASAEAARAKLAKAGFEAKVITLP